MKTFRNFAEKQQLDFLRTELARLLPEGSFAFKLRYAIGRLLEPMSTFFRTNRPQASPAERAFLWLADGNNVAVEQLSDADGRYYDDSGALIPVTEFQLISTSSVMAAYGTWLIEVEAQCSPASCSAATEDWMDPDVREWARLQRLSHKAKCFALAYQALVYAIRLSKGIPLNVEEKEKAAKLHYSKMGRKGGLVKNAKHNALKEYAVTRFETGQWKTAPKAADALIDDVMVYASKINVNWKPARLTLIRWFRQAARVRGYSPDRADFDAHLHPK